MKTVRCYTLKLYGSESKFNDLKWSAYQFTKLTNAFISHFYFKVSINRDGKDVSGMIYLRETDRRKFFIDESGIPIPLRRLLRPPQKSQN